MSCWWSLLLSRFICISNYICGALKRAVADLLYFVEYCSLQQVLTSLQQRQLDELSDWLRRMETLVGEHCSIDAKQTSLEKRLEMHKACGSYMFVSYFHNSVTYFVLQMMEF